MDTTEIEILTAVDDFYQQAFNKLLWFIAALATVIGVIVPLVIQRLQNRSLKIQEDAIKTSVKKELINEIGSDLKKKYDKEIKVLKSQNTKDINKVEALSWFLQGKMQISQNSNDLACGSLFNAAEKSFISRDYLNCNQALNSIEDCLESLNKKQFKESISDFGFNFDEFYNIVKLTDSKGLIFEKVRSIKKIIKNLPEKRE